MKWPLVLRSRYEREFDINLALRRERDAFERGVRTTLDADRRRLTDLVKRLTEITVRRDPARMAYNLTVSLDARMLTGDRRNDDFVIESFVDHIRGELSVSKFVQLATDGDGRGE